MRASPRQFPSLERALAGRQPSSCEGVLANQRPPLWSTRAPPIDFGGRNETIDPVAGHIPGALNHPFATISMSGAAFARRTNCANAGSVRWRGRPASEVIAMCGSGVTACHNLLALEIAGLPGARLYGGSWSEWIRDPSRPVARDHS